MLIFDNRYFFVPVIAWAIAQTLKVIIELLLKREFNAYRFVGAGGMPSSHSALVMALTTTLALDFGWDSPLTAISFIFALVVMYDAAGVRRAAGKQAKILNIIISELQQGNKIIDEKEKLKELLGHTPIEVVAGALLGIIVPYLI
ncbi:divergent PAP2 family protein [Anaerobranca gottschalkii]|uniref:divergent PAP2 family protein n=1 Tax=Anaerobranca gottschalkii TaxID=108328 RepID=UPI001FA90C7B|nr:divergent PAP2 family protein [Anaerobranca gottschalkii]